MSKQAEMSWSEPVKVAKAGARRSPARRWLARPGSLLLPLLVPAALFLLWEVMSRNGTLNPLFFPPPSAVARTWWRLFEAGLLTADLRLTSYRLLVGFALGAAPGIALGMAMGLWKPVRIALLPTVTAIYPVPRIAILPLALVIFGIGESGKLFMVAFSVFFLMLLETMAGVRSIQPVMLDVARSVRASRWQQYWSIALPGALPAILSGTRISLGFALIVIVGTEFVASNKGVGASIWLAYQTLDIETMWAGLATTALMGWVLNAGVSLLERLALPWTRR